MDKIVCVLLALLPVLSAQAAPQSPAEVEQALLQRLLVTGQQSYQGTFIYERNGSFSTHAIWHQRDANGQVRERLLQLDGPAQEVLRLDGHVQCVSDAQADRPEWVSGLLMQPVPVAQLAAHYETRLLGPSRVAGHAAVVLALLPRDQYRYGLELHLDQHTGLVLKSLLLNGQGQLLERFQFTHLDSRSPLNPTALQPSSACLPVSVAPALPAVESPWQAGWLPPGFSLSAAQQRNAQGAHPALTWLMFSDGLARFSVFIEALPNAAVEHLHSQLGPTVIVSRQMPAADGPVLVTVVGEVPLPAAERVAQSITLAAP
ncbi:MAG: MucB/RseB C-terminal domain-containing protein [Pseudomonas sp.]|nr:MucB/RseB C-terminal domain-containing protein [Pseudomonas sp.]